MRVWQLIKCEFLKNFSWKRFVLTFLVLIVSCFCLIKIETFLGGVKTYSEPLDYSEFKSLYQQASNDVEKYGGVFQEGVLEIFNREDTSYKKAYQLIGNEGKEVWQKDVISFLENYLPKQVALEQLKEHYQDSTFKEGIETLENDLYSRNSIRPRYISALSRYQNASLEVIESELEYLDRIIDFLEKSIEENAYYLYMEAMYHSTFYYAFISDTEISPVNLKRLQYVIDNKIKDATDYRAINASQYQFFFTMNVKVPTLEEYNSGDIYKYGDYEATKRFYQDQQKLIDEQRKIIEYAFENDLKHDLYFSDQYSDTSYVSSKKLMNQGLHLGLIIIFLVAIMHAGIVAKEHDNGTVKLLLTKPVKRSKILLAKFLYLVLETLAFWLLGSVIMFLLVGFTNGFDDLFTAKLIVSGGKVREVSYILWYLKEMLICSIPVCCFLVFLFSLSTITLNTALTASLVSVVSVISLFIWNLIANFGLTFLNILAYTPIPYLDFWFVRYHSEFYMKSVVGLGLNDSYGIIISLIVGIILYFVTVLIYKKRDIKN